MGTSRRAWPDSGVVTIDGDLHLPEGTSHVGRQAPSRIGIVRAYVNQITLQRYGMSYPLGPDAVRRKGHAMTWPSDSTWVVIYAILAALFMYSWAVVPA